MKIYVDLVFIINLLIDFLLLLTVSFILKRNVKISRLILGSLVGGVSIVFLFYKPSSIMLFLYKIVISFFMVITSFGFKDIKYFVNNFLYLYLTSVVLGGTLYLIKDQVSFDSLGLMFTDNNFQFSLLFIIMVIPIILFFYVKQIKSLKNNYSNYYKVDVIYKNNTYKFNAFLDTGNKLKDQYKNRPIILIHSDKINFSYEESILVPFKTLDGGGLLKCIEVDKIIIDNKKIIIRPLLGEAKHDFNIEGINMILNNETL